MPAVLKIIIIFVAVVVSLKLKSPLGASLFAGAIALGLWLGMPLNMLGNSVLFGVTDPPNLVLLVIVLQIVLFSAILSETKQLRKMVTAVSDVIENPRIAVPIMTAVIGLLPMPGGARFSAPLVDEASRHLKADNDHKSAINYWFRHVWEYWWPFYPSVILISAISGFSLMKIVIISFPATIVTVVVGYYFFLRQLPKPVTKTGPKTKGAFLRLLSIGRSIIAVIILNLLLTNARSMLASRGFEIGALPTRFPLVIALVVGIAMALWGKGLTFGTTINMIANKRVAMTMLTIASILIFSAVLKDAGAIEDITESLASSDVPLLLLAFSVPFLVGFVTGIVVAYVGIALPILFPVFEAALPESQLIAYVFIFSVSGFVAVMLTPVHLCLILSNEYFKVRFIQVGRLMIMPCVVEMSLFFGIFLLYLML